MSKLLRFSKSLDMPDLTLTRPQAVFDLLQPHMVGLGEEHLFVIGLNRKMKLIAYACLTVGNDQFTIVCPKQIFRWALKQGRSGASAVILAHNHPSGDPTPSPQDRDVTHRVAQAGRVLGITLADHLVMTDDAFVSLAEQGEIPAYAALAAYTA